MSTASFVERIDYPESDGKPMGETDLHRRWMIRIYNLLEYRYRKERVYIGSDLLVYYAAGQPTRYIVPDNFVVFDCDPGDRQVFKTWEEKRCPDVVFEVTSRGTSTKDIVDKPIIYEQMRVSEYFLYDPNARYLRPSLQGYRLLNGVLSEIPSKKGVLTSERLGVQLRLDDNKLEMIDIDSGDLLLTEAEAERRARLEAEARLHELQAELARFKRDQNG